MARYREKDETDLVWNRTRRRLTRELDTEIQNFREEILNQVLTHAWNDYTKALDSGTLVELEEETTQWVRGILQNQLQPAIETRINGASSQDKEA